MHYTFKMDNGEHMEGKTSNMIAVVGDVRADTFRLVIHAEDTGELLSILLRYVADYENMGIPELCVLLTARAECMKLEPLAVTQSVQFPNVFNT